MFNLERVKSIREVTRLLQIGPGAARAKKAAQAAPRAAARKKAATRKPVPKKKAPARKTRRTAAKK